MIHEEITFDRLPEAMAYIINELEQLKKMVQSITHKEDKKEVIDIDEAAHIIKKAKSTIYTLVRKGAIPAHKRGKKLYFFEDELLSWISNGTSRSAVKTKQDAAEFINKGINKKPARRFV